MEDAMVTGRMAAEKKAAANRILEREGLNASQAINLLYDKIIEEGSADFLYVREIPPEEWKEAARFVDSISVPYNGMFDNMTRGEIKLAKAKAKGWI